MGAEKAEASGKRFDRRLVAERVGEQQHLVAPPQICRLDHVADTNHHIGDLVSGWHLSLLFLFNRSVDLTELFYHEAPEEQEWQDLFVIRAKREIFLGVLE
jgi:hypothetical protein